MKALLNIARISVFGLAAVAAFAFTKPGNEVNELWGVYNGAPYNVTNVSMGNGPDQYRCVQESIPCLYEDEEASIPVEGVQGTFIPGANLQPGR